jgi:hypothetical protein
MIVCGLWHEATPVFIAWGAYHGILLISHRIGQQMKRLLGVPTSVASRSLSYASTFALISMGWLIFRARDMTQAMSMWQVMLSPSAYGEFSMPVAFYGVVIVVAVGWAMYHSGEAQLSRLRAVYTDSRSAEAAAPGGRNGGLDLAAVEVVEFCAARKWWWLAPAVLLMALFTGLAIRDLELAAPRTPFMYTLF